MSKTPFQSHKAGEISSSVSKAADFERMDIRCESKRNIDAEYNQLFKVVSSQDSA